MTSLSAPAGPCPGSVGFFLEWQRETERARERERGDNSASSSRQLSKDAWK